MALSIAVLFLSRNLGLFWDNVLFVGKMGGYLYEHSPFNWTMPDSFDPGHPPFIGMIQAIGWKLFGKSLWVSHLMMWPFVLGFLVQVYQLSTHFFEDAKWRWLMFFLVLADPTISAELVHVSPEIIQNYFFLWAINSIFSQKHIQKAIALAFLGIVFFRGMMLCFGVFLFDFLRHVVLRKQTLQSFFSFKNLAAYAVGALPAVIFVAWRLATKGWLQAHPDSPWAELWRYATLPEFLRNVLVLGNRLADFGRYLLLLFVGISLFKPGVWKNPRIRELLLLSVTSIFAVTITSLISTNAFGHRYFIPFFIGTTCLAVYILKEYTQRKKLGYVLLSLSLLTGNLWVYPRHIAQGWSASLAHVTYFELRREAIHYMDEHNIPVEQCGTFFPNSVKISEVDLANDTREFPYFKHQEFAFYSNVYNLSDEELEQLDNAYAEIHQFKKGLVSITLYKRLAHTRN